MSITRNQVALNGQQVVALRKAGTFGMVCPQRISLSEKELVWGVVEIRNPPGNCLECALLESENVFGSEQTQGCLAFRRARQVLL